MNIKPNEDKLSLPIEILDLNPHTRHIPKRANVSTLLDIVNLGQDGLSYVYQLGVKQVPYVLNKLDEFLTQSKAKTLAELRSNLSDYTQRPFLYVSYSSDKPNLVQELVPFIKALTKNLDFQHDYEIIKRRYGLENSKSYTLQEVGDYFGITREG